jgi:acyl carrier protein
MSNEAIEAVVEAAWRQILQTDHVADGDNFFELGGDSMSALEFIDTVRRATSCELSLQAVFKNGTLGAVKNACVTGATH